MHTFENSNHNVSQDGLFFPATKEYGRRSEYTVAEQIEALKFEFDMARRRMDKEIAKCDKLEEKGLRVLFGGYYKKEEQMRG